MLVLMPYHSPQLAIMYVEKGIILRPLLPLRPCAVALAQCWPCFVGWIEARRWLGGWDESPLPI